MQIGDRWEDNTMRVGKFNIGTMRPSWATLKDRSASTSIVGKARATLSRIWKKRDTTSRSSSKLISQTSSCDSTYSLDRKREQAIAWLAEAKRKGRVKHVI